MRKNKTYFYYVHSYAGAIASARHTTAKVAGLSMYHPTILSDMGQGFFLNLHWRMYD